MRNEGSCSRVFMAYRNVSDRELSIPRRSVPEANVVPILS
jgi:hypothetical protein